MCRRILAVALPLVGVCVALPAPLAARADGAAACLRDAVEVVELGGDYGFEQFHRFAPADHVAFDARGAKWRFQTYPIPRAADPVRITGGGRRACFLGGLIEGANPPSAGWEEIYEVTNGAAFAFGGDEPLEDFVLRGLRVHNVWDGIRPRAGARSFVVEDVWLSDVRDDCIENDHFATGVIDDALLDGCHMAISARNPREPASYGARVLTIKDSLIRLKPFPKPRRAMLRRHPWTRDPGHGMFFKWSRNSMRVRLHGNVFMLEQLSNNRPRAIDLPPVVSCGDNVLVWLGPGDPGPVPGCFEVVRERRVWDAAKAAWIERHPEIMRLPQDPPSRRAPRVGKSARAGQPAERIACAARAGVLACAGTACRCMPYRVGRSATNGADVAVSGTVLDVDTANIGGPWQVTVDAGRSGTVELVIPSGNPGCTARWDLAAIQRYRPGDRIAARGFVFGANRVRVCMAASHYVRAGGPP